MKIRLLLTALIAVMILTDLPLFAQADDPLNPNPTGSVIYLGPVAGYNRSMHSVTLASFVDKTDLCPYFENGSSNGFHFGVFYEQYFGQKTNSRHSVVFRALYNSYPSSFSHIGDRYPSLVEQSPGVFTTVISQTEHSLAVSYTTLALDVMYKFNVIGGLVLTAGPTFDFPLTKNLIQKYEIIEPLNVQFKKITPTAQELADGFRYENNDRTIVVYDGDIGKGGNTSSLRFGMKFGVQYEIITGTKIDIIPGLFYNLGLTNAADAQSWKVHAIQASVDIRYAL